MSEPAPSITISPCIAEVPDAALDALRARLRMVRRPDELPGVGWDYGVPLGYVQELVERWQFDYEWAGA